MVTKRVEVATVSTNRVRRELADLGEVPEKLIGCGAHRPITIGGRRGSLNILPVATALIRVLASHQASSADRLLEAVPVAWEPVLLDSSDGSGWSLLAWRPEGRLEGAVSPGEPVGSRPPLARINPCHLLAGIVESEAWEREWNGAHLQGGWIGWLGYDCGHACEPFPWTPPSPLRLPDYRLRLYRRSVAISPEGEAMLLWADDGSTTHRAVLEEWRTIQQRSARALPPHTTPTLQLAPVWNALRFQTAVDALRAWIGEGELYQANLSHPLRGRATGSPAALFSALRSSQPVAMGAAQLWPGGALLSCSPERFLRIEEGRLETRPIKGTAPRGRDADEDRRQREQLATSEKELAELAMIVDMARNDLGRVAVPGSVAVVSSGTIETFPSLFHRVATVRAQLGASADLTDLLCATLPPASVTGAPKVRALQAIAELEGESRGPYCGVFGCLEPGGLHADFSVLIRTLLLHNGMAEHRVGAGIVWDSDPKAEWRETLAKADYLRPVLGRDAMMVP